jgi:hypothetical protein
MPEYITHAYIANQAGESLNYIAGTIFCDLGNFVSLYKKEIDFSHKNMAGFAKYLEKQKYNKDFIEGIKAHIKLDHYVHKFYVIPVSIKLAKKTHLDNVNVFHHMAEVYVARRILREYPSFMRVVRRAAKLSNNLVLKKHLVDYYKGVPIIEMFDAAYRETMSNKMTILHQIRGAWRFRKYLAHATGAIGWQFIKSIRKVFKELYFELRGSDKDLERWIDYQRDEISKIK